MLRIALGVAGFLVAAGPLPVLPRSVLAGLPASTAPLTVSELASDVGSPAFAQRLDAWGFARGRERIFRGNPQRLGRVVSRTLEFDGPRGARSYVGYLAAHAARLYGIGTSVRPLSSRGRAGFLLTAASCACHRAMPTLLGVLAHGRRVTWLELNGGAADAAAVTRLIGAAP